MLTFCSDLGRILLCLILASKENFENGNEFQEYSDSWEKVVTTKHTGE